MIIGNRVWLYVRHYLSFFLASILRVRITAPNFISCLFHKDSYMKNVDGIKLYSFTLMTLISLSGCGGNSGDNSTTSTNVSASKSYSITDGSFQKGPFVAGTTVTVQELDDNLMPTGASYTTTTNSIGYFSVPQLIKSRFVEVFANGFYYDELSFKNSTAPITLRGIVDLSKNDKLPSINILTTLQTNRLRTLKSQGLSFEQAQSSSKNAVLDVFAIPSGVVNSFNEVSLVGDTLSDSEFLRATIAMLKVAQAQGISVEANLTSQMGLLAEDLNDDGQVNGLAKQYLPLLIKEKNAIDPSYIQNNLKNYIFDKNQNPDNEILYKFEETKGTLAKNEIVGKWDATIFNAVRAKGRVGNGIDFSVAKDGYLAIDVLTNNMNNNNKLLISDDKISISTWIKLSSLDLTKTYQIMADGPGGLQSFKLALKEGKLDFTLVGYNPVSIITSKAQLSTDKWYHIAVTYDGSEAIFYIDGEVDNTRSIIHPIDNVYNDIYIGGDGDGYYGTDDSLPGMLDEFRFATTIKTASEIKEFYIAGK